jgi:hypothetical protein
MDRKIVFRKNSCPNFSLKIALMQVATSFHIAYISPKDYKAKMLHPRMGMGDFFCGLAIYRANILNKDLTV